MLPLSRGGAEMGKIGEIVRDVSPESLARANEDNLAEGLAARARAYGGDVRDGPPCGGLESCPARPTGS